MAKHTDHPGFKRSSLTAIGPSAPSLDANTGGDAVEKNE